MSQKYSLKKTMNYDLFEMYPINRDIGKIRMLEKSMRKHGFLPSHPLHVVKGNNGKYAIKAGHHRYIVATKYSLPIYFVIGDDNATMFDLESANNPWAMVDYLNAYVRDGIKDYAILKRYIEETGIPLSCAATILSNKSIANPKNSMRFKRGEFEIDWPNNSLEIKLVIIELKKINREDMKSALFFLSLLKALKTDAFKLKVFIDKINRFPHILTKQRSMPEYLDMIETLYNYHTKKNAKISIKFALINK